MRSDSSGPFTTLLMMVPLVVVPLLAVFGIPQFAPISASPSGDDKEFDIDFDLEPTGSAAAKTAAPPSGDIFAPYSSAGANAAVSSPSAAPTTATEGEGLFSAVGENQGWSDPFQQPQSQSQAPSPAAASAPPSRANTPAAAPWNPPEAALREWELDAARASEIGSSTSGDIRESTAVVRNNFNEPAPARSDERSAAPLTWRSAVDRLNRLGIGDFQLERGERDLFLFSCSYSPPDRPRVSHRFEAEAAEPLAAVEDVLRQVEGWSQLRVAETTRAPRAAVNEPDTK
jgi:hypothetical protein